MKKKTRIPLFSIRDLSDAGQYLLLLIVGWILPLRALWIAVAPLAIIHSYIRRPSLAASDWLREAIIQTSYRGTPRDFEISRLRFTYHEIALLLRHLRPGGVRLPIELIGREHIDEGLAAGRGVILLIGAVTYSTFVAKAAMGAAGIPVSHLSIPGHSSSGTQFGRKVITRAHTAVENRFINERVIMSTDSFVRPLKTLERHLKENGVVSITGLSGDISIRIPCLGGTIELGRAAPGLSRMTGAALLPVFTLPSHSGGFIVRVGEPLKADGEGAHFEKALACEFGTLLENFIREHPTRWAGWPGWDHSVANTD